MKKDRQLMKRVLSFIMAFAMVLSLMPTTVFAAETPTTLYLVPNSNWKSDNARFAIYCFGNGETWVDMSDADGDGYYEGTVPEGYTSIIFCRMNPSDTNNSWDTKWNQTSDLTLPTDGTNCYTVADGTWDKGGGTWSHVHSYTSAVTAPTCTQGGYTTYTCAYCEESKIGDEVAATGHSWSDGVCGTCGATCDHAYTDGVCTVCGMEEPEEEKDVTLYLVPNSNWKSDNARFALVLATSDWSASKWVDMTDADGDGYYEGEIPSDGNDYTIVIFCRMNPSATANDWSNKWNQTADLTLPTDGTNCYTVAEGTWDKGDGTWSVYAPDGDGDETDPTDPPATTDPTDPDVSEPETITVYFRNDWLWPEVYVHYWNDSQGTSWPGEKMTFVETTDAGDVYSAEIPTWATGLLFNGLENGNASNRQQTPNITEFADGDAFYIHWDGENKASKFDYTPSSGGEETDPTDPSEPEEPVEATYIIAGTGELCGTAWDPANTANTMTLNAETGLYEKTYESVAKGSHSFKVTDGTWNNCWGGTGADGNYEFTLDAISDVTITFDASTKTIAVTHEATGEVAESVDHFTLHYRNTGMWETVNAYGWLSGTSTNLLGAWPGTAVTENADHPNWYTVELNDLAENAGIGILFNKGDDSGKTGDIMIKSSGEYWYDGALLTEAPDTWEDGSVENVTYEVTLHFANSLGWGSVNLYTWTAAGNPNGSWPGTACGLDSDGFYSLNFTYEAPDGQGLNFIFNGGGVQTVDLALAASDFVDNKAEKWVVPTTTDSEGKYYADIVDSPDAIAISPVVDGTSVTFAYKGSTTDTVEVYGSMNDWASGYAMTCNEYGVFSVTIDDVGYGIHQYKFVVNGNWILDPINGFVITEESGNQNSAFLISNPEADTNTVKINVHFDAPTTEWNVCAWGAPDLDAQYDFTDGVTTITLDGRASQYVAFKVRKSIEGNDWAEQSGEIRIDLGNIVSGTIDVYVGSDFSVSQNLNDDVVYANKVSSVEYDYDNNTITVKTGKAVEDPETAFAIYKDGADAGIIDTITASGSTYTLTLTETLDLVTLYQYTVRFSEQVKFADSDYVIGINTVYASTKFGNEFTYDGELGALWSSESTTFVVWAPTAASVSVNLYTSGTAGTDDLIESVAMEQIENGAWKATVEGDLNGTYYTYAVNVDGETVEAVDPYARTTGVNGKRGMVINLDSTDPTGWASDKNPNPITSYTDAVIYELHVRDFSIDDSSGMVNKGKYLAFTEEGTTTANGAVTGIDYLDDLGITHVHLLPVYDYGSVDETTCSNFNWGYDPVNYNTPEGSYSTNPYNGATRVNEFKQMVMALHDADISVIMDVVYNHVYDAGKFCMNQIVPKYFSRVNADGSYSNGSGCGNDTASEREMVRKYIVESVLYWHQEYHIDGFRFDLVGLLDATTINQIVKEVHACCPDVIFYGEGWTMGTAVEPGNTMATQANSAATPNFAYFSDTIRNLLAGSNGSSLGFVSGQTGQEEAIANNFMAMPWWSQNPGQIVQYASCHDNYTLIDKLILSNGKSGIDADIIKMNNLAAAIYMTSQGIPFIHAGEEFLREKLEEGGGRCENSYNASDYVNHIEWSNLENETYASNSDYYKGLIAFRKAHEALRMETNAAITANIDYTWVTNEVVMFTIDGVAAGDISDSIAVIFNATSSAKSVTLPEGEWSVCINATQSGTDVIETVSGTVSVDGISAMVLVQGQNDPTHVHDWENGTCAGCGETCTHTFVDGTCTNCGLVCNHDWNDDYCPNCGTYCGHEWVDGTCTVCGMVCDHAVHWQNGLCSNCLAEVEHEYSENGLCSCGKSLCEHTSHNINGMCDDCGLAVGHTMGEDGICTVCGYNQNLMAFLAGSMNSWSTSANALQSIGGTKVAGSMHFKTGTYTFKIVYNNNWYGNGGTIASTASGWVMDSESNCTLNAQYDGMYTFVYDTAANTLDVYAKITEPLYLRGDFNEWGTTDALSLSGGDVQTATVTLEAGTYEFKIGNDDWTFGAPAENISVTLSEKSYLTVTATYNGDGTWTVEHETEKWYAAQNGETVYTTLAEALEAAESGDTVQLLADTTEAYVQVTPGVTLDLNGHTLTADYVVGFNSSKICDSTNNQHNCYEAKGLLVVEPDNLVLPENNGAVPVYNPDKEGFIFVDFLFNTGVVPGDGITTVNMLATSHTMEVIDLLKDGAADNYIQVVVRLAWDNENGTAYQNFVFNEDTVSNVMGSNTGTATGFGRMFYVNITGLEDLTGVTATVMIISDSNAVDASNSYSVN